MLPGYSGEELLPQIKEIPVIVISAKAGVDSKVETLLSGARDYLSKPFSLKELLARNHGAAFEASPLAPDARGFPLQMFPWIPLPMRFSRETFR